MSGTTKPPPDQVARDAIVSARDRNVVVEAGAGTGKTTTLVLRILAMIAPEDDTRAMSLDRIAAVTFTRRAAGEIRLKLRERILAALGAERLTSVRRGRLATALAQLDTANVGTIHSFADRLLRAYPMEANLSPSYAIADEIDPFVRETFDILLHGAETGTLATELSPALVGRAAECERTILDALTAGILAETRETEHASDNGLDALFRAFIEQRDVPPGDIAVESPDLAEVDAQITAALKLAKGMRGESRGAAKMLAIVERLKEARAEKDPIEKFRILVAAIGSKPKLKMGDDFQSEKAPWTFFKQLFDGDDPLAAQIRAPLNAWLSHRLVRLFPVVTDVYERVKERQRVVDQIDLLIKLRDLLATRLDVRREYQERFDHILVDEFQDTDPLQAEIVLYLTEAKPVARTWRDVKLAPGKLTIVGDPKQSIYRFRRADVAMYDEVRNLVLRDGTALHERLTANFRSTPSLIDWFNHRFEDLLEPAPRNGALFDPQTGRVFYQPLENGRAGGQPDGGVHRLTFSCDEPKKGPQRETEAEALAHYLRWLVEKSERRIQDPVTREMRRIAYGDVAVLVLATSQLPTLLGAFQRLDVPHAVSGGKLFLKDPLHRQFLLGLRAIADRKDGVAVAALMRPPFFAVDLLDLFREKAEAPDDERAKRAAAARAFVSALRKDRFDRPPGEIARDLLEGTAFARTVVMRENGVQRLAHLRELCHQIGALAASEGLDFDAVTARARGWIDDPAQLDAPRPVGAAAVEVLTVHRAKGLEFPVTVLWDSQSDLAAPRDSSVWRCDRASGDWLLRLKGLSWEEGSDVGFAEREKAFANNERKRMVYVAATRARDMLTVPQAVAHTKNSYVAGRLLDDGLELTKAEPLFMQGQGAPWSALVAPIALPAPWVDAGTAERMQSRWSGASRIAGTPHHAPTAVTKVAHAKRVVRDDEVERTERRVREGRYGPVFGETVHLAIGFALCDVARNFGVCVDRAVSLTGLSEHRDEAVADVTRALATLETESLARAPGADLHIEYPVAAAHGSERLVAGYVDLLAVRGAELLIVDFKTAQAPPTVASDVKQTHPKYVEQVKLYAEMLREDPSLRAMRIRCGLLFTAESGVRWV